MSQIAEWPLVTVSGPGTRGVADQCFYCHRYAGKPHGRECVVVCKKAKVRYTVEIEIEVPHFWDGGNVEFHRNEGSWCANNLIAELEKAKTEDLCLCNRVECNFVEFTDETPRVSD